MKMRGDRGFTLDETYPAYLAASDWYLALLGGIPDDRWDRPGLGEWTVRELAAHTSRAYLTLVEYLEPTGRIDVDSPAGYFRRAIPDPAANASIAARARDEAVLLGADPVPEVSRRAQAARRAVEQAPPGAVCVTRGGTLSLADFLATRVVELTVHTLDLGEALGRAEEPPESAATLSLTVLAALAASPSAGVLLRALTGRIRLPLGFSVFP